MHNREKKKKDEMQVVLMIQTCLFGELLKR